MSLDALRAQLPDYAKDLRLNLESVLSEAGAPGLEPRAGARGRARLGDRLAPPPAGRGAGSRGAANCSRRRKSPACARRRR